ncbi:hypothetical protein [Candidatus Enterovibrio altilux]|uniref:Mobile element protein n=1 Tax=Candidatus Enterovibrio altilux TaxID=1927128 RepID=A0A291B6R7_9GAMM|nr:hypothetical protein BTN50_0144 [Candidatus Enterovibrio luxaltus]
MIRIKKPLGGTSNLSERNAQIKETHATIQALNKLNGLSMPKT